MLFSSKQDQFFQMLSDIAESIRDAARYFENFRIKNEADLKEFATVMKQYEEKADSHIHELITALNTTFITPLDREDILELAVKMDDILDGMEACTSRLAIYNIIKPNNYMDEFTEYLNKSVEEIYQSVKLLKEKDLTDIRSHVIKINDYETVCDNLLRVCIKDLFTNEKDPIRIIQYKELYEQLEEISDNCEDVANTLETIIMKNS
jgi:predicted phosphate transport protein (TIGR00153 family)